MQIFIKKINGYEENEARFHFSSTDFQYDKNNIQFGSFEFFSRFRAGIKIHYIVDKKLQATDLSKSTLDKIMTSLKEKSQDQNEIFNLLSSTSSLTI